ncbi:MAG: hypothetical protein IPP88_22430 [Betaproteobacteria bacterium]|nr:hypothetical protein [Betaproteobacteria bacterium]
MSIKNSADCLLAVGLYQELGRFFPTRIAESKKFNCSESAEGVACLKLINASILPSSAARIIRFKEAISLDHSTLPLTAVDLGGTTLPSLPNEPTM